MLLRPLYLLLIVLWGSAQPLACAQTTHPAAPPDTLAPRPARLPWLDSLLAAAPALRQHQVGLSVADAATGELLYELNEARGTLPRPA